MLKSNEHQPAQSTLSDFDEAVEKSLDPDK